MATEAADDWIIPGEHRAHQHTQQGIFKGGEQPGKLGHLRQRADGAAHQLHAVHQNGKAHHDAPHVPAPLALGAHDQQDTRQSDQGREVLRLQQVHKDVLTLDAGERQNPRRQGGADVGAHDDADGLSQLHDAGVHQAHQHHRHGGGGLDGDGDARAQQQALEGAGGHALEHPLQLAAGHLFQALGHDGHAVQEERQAAAEGKDGENVHNCAFLSQYSRPSGTAGPILSCILRSNIIYAKRHAGKRISKIL